LIQYALEWYHVPEFARRIIFAYYDLLSAQVVTKDWKTPFFDYDIGLFQGCVLSVILFDVVFSLLLDFLGDLERLGYDIKEGPIVVFHKAYADDLTLVTKDPAGNQKALDRTDTFLRWTRCMKAKPAKCRCLAAKAFTAPRSKIKPFTRRQYSSFDPQLSVSGQPIPFIRDEPFKFLGRQIYHDLLKRNRQWRFLSGSWNIFDSLMSSLLLER
jgi:hypothetical protein